MTTTVRWGPWWALVATAGTALVALGLMVIPQSDDWYYACQGRDRGIFPAIAASYLGWTALWAYLTIHIGILGYLGPFAGVRLLSLAAMLALGSGLWAILKAHFPHATRPILTLGTLGILTLGIVNSQAQEGVFWGSTTGNYCLGCAAVFHLWAWAVRHSDYSRHQLFGIVLLASVIPGLSEAVTVGAVGLMFLGLLLHRRRSTSPWKWALLGLGLGLIPLLASPGNAQRLAANGGWHPWSESLGLVANSLTQYLHGPTMLLWASGVAFPVLVAWRSGPVSDWRHICVIVLTLPIIGGAAMLPAALATGEITPHIANLGWYTIYAASLISSTCLGRWMATIRSESIHLRIGGSLLIIGFGFLIYGISEESTPPWEAFAFFLLGGAALADRGLALGLVRKATWISLAVLLFRHLGPDACFRAPLRYMTWLERDRILRQAAEHGDWVVKVPPLPDHAYPRLSFLTDLTGNPNYGWTMQIAHWYGVHRIWLDMGQVLPPALKAHWEADFAQEVLRHTPGSSQP